MYEINTEETKQNDVALGKDVQNQFVWTSNITTIDLSGRNIKTLGAEVELPKKLVELNLSHNELTSVPTVVLNLEFVKILDLSSNNIIYFDNTPNFCQTIESLNISNNNLKGPPYWVWAESPKKLSFLNLSCNENITVSFVNGYFEELLQYKTLITSIDMYNCRLDKCIKLFSTFPKAKNLNLGIIDYTYSKKNKLVNVPCEGLNMCCDLERLIICNTHTYSIDLNIDMYKNLIEINLSENYLSNLPETFCNLENLQVCVLSCNNLLYLPENISKLKKLKRLHLDSNVLCMLPNDLSELENLCTLDLYDNHICEIPDGILALPEIDIARNYLEEPENEDYLNKKLKLRIKITGRSDGRKLEDVNYDTEYNTSSESEDDEIKCLNLESEAHVQDNKANDDSSSSPEDWDSDDYWIPHGHTFVMPTKKCSPWLYFVKKKMAEGNFCPMDMHPVSISETILYQKMCNPQPFYESDGQFEDYSSDDS